MGIDPGDWSVKTELDMVVRRADGTEQTIKESDVGRESIVDRIIAFLFKR